MTHDPDIKAFDHHQEGMNNCSFSLLLKHWGVWEKANEAYPWIIAQEMIDTSGLSLFLKQRKISHDDYFQLNSSIETVFKELIQKYRKIEGNNKKHKLLFLIMKQIGISNYYKLIEGFDSQLDIQFMSKQRIDENPSKGIPVLMYLLEN